MGYKYLTVRVNENGEGDANKKTFADLCSELSGRQKEKAAQAASLAKDMESPVAVFRSEYRSYYRRSFKFRGVCEEKELAKFMAKVVTKDVHDKRTSITVYSPDKEYAKAIKKRLKKKHKEASTAYFGRSQTSIATILVS